MSAVSSWVRKHFINLSKFTLVGIFASILNILFVWLFIDILFLNTALSTAVVVLTIFVLKFYLFRIIKLINKQFFKYASIQLASAVLNIFFNWLLIDIFLIDTILAATVVVAGLFVGRYIFFELTGLMKK